MQQIKLDDVEVPEELLELLGRSRLSTRDRAGQIRAALAVYLLVSGEVSIEKAAELAGESRANFERLLQELGLPAVRYESSEYEQDGRSIRTLDDASNSA